MNSEIKGNEGKFGLTVLGALGMVILYYFIINSIIEIPFDCLSRCISSHKILKLIVYGLKSSISGVVMIILLLKKIRKDYDSDFKISYIEKFNFKILICTIFSMVGLYLCIQSSIGPVLAKLPVPKIGKEAFEELNQNTYLVIILSIIVGPIIEEVVMRGVILEGLLNKNKQLFSIIVSAVIFGLIHMNLPQGINATILGILLGYIYYKTRSLVLCIVCHMVNNIIADFMVNPSIISFLMGIAIFVTAIVFFKRCLKRLDSNDANLKKNIA